MLKVKNIDAGPRGIHAGGELIMLMPGEEREIEVSDGDRKAAEKTRWFAIESKATAPVPVDVDALTDEQLRALLTDRKVRVPESADRAKLLDAARKVAT